MILQENIIQVEELSVCKTLITSMKGRVIKFRVAETLN